ncbi:Dual specificity protein kinase pom1 [Candida viswanathii]|uniref:Dual specificity protein kinase pom1 n=1 Tax=Candida viswanathii TaxID=5486 RepID=A0A367YAX9_9ASCO|nr:Dual specificity protein kinase pom1 [Candida viswanathii]
MSNENIALFENKFSQIELNHRMNLGKKLSPTKRKKLLYPQHLYPPLNPPNQIAATASSNPPPAFKTPNLAKTPTTPNRLSSTNVRTTCSRDSSFSNGSYNTPARERVLSCPMSDSSTLKQDYQFSFMRDTSSSLQKKQTITPFNNKSRIISKSPSSGSSSTKKRLEYARQLSQRTKRHSSNNNTASPSVIQLLNDGEGDTDKWKQDLLDPSPVRYSGSDRDDVMMLDDSPSKPRRHVTQPLPNAPGNVFDRLYPKTTTPKLVAPKIPKDLAPPKVKYQAKIDSIPQLYEIVHASHPRLFAETESKEQAVRLPYDLQSLPLDNLNEYERGEIIRTKKVYYLPERNLRSINISSHGTNFGFDDANGNYIVIPQDHINYRYEILSNLGTGSFGNVVLARDHKTANLVAVKIINNHVNGSLQQSVNEIKMLKMLQERNAPDQCKLVAIMDHFSFRSHMCIISELLSINLYSMLEVTNFQGLGYSVIQNISQQLLLGLQAIHDCNIIHCDIKPENVMIKLPSSPQSNDFTVKIIDFGSSCFSNETSFQYIQSRFYRAPEVLLGASYDQKIDIWSLGCLLVEIFTGVPLFPGKNEYEQVGHIMEVFGPPKSTTIIRMRLKLTRKNNQILLNLTDTLSPATPMVLDKMYKKTLLYKIFDHAGKLNLHNLQQYCNDSSQAAVKKQFKISSKSLEGEMGLSRVNLSLAQKQNMVLFLQKMFVLEPSERSDARDLLALPFLE